MIFENETGCKLIPCFFRITEPPVSVLKIFSRITSTSGFGVSWKKIQRPGNFHERTTSFE